MLQHIQLIIFDLDYVVFDCSKLKVQALRQSLISLADIIPHDVRLPDATDAEEGFRDYGVRWMQHIELGLDEENLEHLQQAYELNENRLVNAGAGNVFPGLRELIAECGRLGAGAAMGAEANRDYLVSVSDRHELEHLFQISLCSEEFGPGNTEEMLEEILHYAEVNPSEALVVGTRPRFFEAAHNVDLTAIGCGWGIHQHQSLTEADLQVLTPPEFYSAIQKADQLASRKL